MALEGFVQVVPSPQGDIAVHLPVVEVAGDDHRRLGGQGFEQLAQQGQLLLPVAFQQAQVHADGMHFGVARHLQYAVQQAPALGAGDRDVKVAVLADGEFRQQGIAVVAVGVHRIAPVGVVAPHAVGEKFVLRLLGPVVQA